MAFRPIILTNEGDELTLPEQKALYDEVMMEIPTECLQTADPDTTKIGAYTITTMKASNPEAFGSPTFESKEVIIGVHSECEGRFVFWKTSKTHRVLTCRTCYLRIPLPSDVVTYGDLRKFVTSRLTP